MPFDVLLVRHAHAAGVPPGGSDAERPLSIHGVEQARQLGALLRELVGALSVTLLCSPARRTRQTAELLELGPVALARSLGLEEQGSEGLIDLMLGGPHPLVAVSHQPNLLGAAHGLVSEADQARLQLPTTGLIGLRLPSPGNSTWSLSLLGSASGLRELGAPQ